MVALGPAYKRKYRAPYRLSGEYVALDFETDGLNVYSGAQLFCWSYTTELGEAGFMWRTEANMRWLKRLMMDKTKNVIFHNKKFDLAAMLGAGMDIYNFKATTHCTLILAKLTNAMWMSYKLKHLGSRLLNRPTNDKDEIEQWLKDNKREFKKEHGRDPNFSDAPADVIKRRAIWDTETTLLLFARLWPDVKNSNLGLYKTECALVYVCIDMEAYGVQVDITRAKEKKAQAEKDMAILIKEIKKIVGPLTVTKIKDGEPIEVYVPTEDFNPGSPIHLPAAWRKVGIELKYKTKPTRKKDGTLSGGGNWSFNEYSMMRYVSDDIMHIMRTSSEEGWPAIKFYRKIRHFKRKNKLHSREVLPPLIRKYQELKMMVSTFYNAILNKSVDRHTASNGREYATLHCSFNPTTAVTGRFSSSGPNLQNLPRTKGPRECFVPRKGKRNWHLDYDQVEMKIFVHFAKDKGMAEAIEKDIHQYVAAKVYEVPLDKVTSEQRKRGKSVGFGTLYGSGAATMAETMTKNGLKTDKESAIFLVKDYHENFPSVRQTTRRFDKELRLQGFLINSFGRRYHIPVKFGYKALNYMCQGTSADIIKVAMVALWRWLRDNNFRSRLIMTIHDEIVLECPRSEEKTVIPQALRIMEDKDNYFVPITASAEIVTHRWSDKRDATKPRKKGGMGYAWAA